MPDLSSIAANTSGISLSGTDRPNPSEDTARRRSSTIFWDCFEFDRKARFIIDASQKVECANASARDLLKSEDLSLNSQGQVRFRSARAQATFEDTLETARRDANRWHHGILAIADGDWVSLSVRCLGQAPGVFDVVIGSPQSKIPPDMDSIAACFGLTAAETKILAGLVSNLCPKRIATINNISIHTVRAHLRAIYGKLGTRGSDASRSLVLRLLD